MTVSKLPHGLPSPERARKLFETLESTDKHVLRYLLSQGGCVPESEVVTRYPDAPPAIRRLLTAPLVYRETGALEDNEPALCLPREYATFISLTPTEKSTLAGLLSRQPLVYGADLSRAHGWPETMPRRQQVHRLKKQWLDETALRTAVDGLPEAEAALWRQIRESDGITDTKLLQQQGYATALQPGHLNTTQPIEGLYAKGLLFPNQLPHPTSFLIPSDVLERLQEKKPVRSFSASGVPRDLRTWGLRLLSDLQLWAGYQTSGRLQFTLNDIPLRHQLRHFLKAIGIHEESYGLFLNIAIEAIFGAVVKRSTQVLDANPAESMSRLIAYWRDSERWQESQHVRDARRVPDGRLDKTLQAKRMIVLKVLEDLPERQWVAWGDFEERVFASGWKRVDAGIPSSAAYYHNERWQKNKPSADLSSEETLEAMVAEPLTWLGLVDVGLGKIKKHGWELTHLRLTDWGKQFLDKKTGRIEALPPVAVETQFRVLPNLDVNVSPRLRPDLLSHLFKIAALKGVNAFALTKESLREALDEGLSVKEILDFLKKNSAHDVPAMVEQFVQEVGERHGHIKLGIAGAYLQVDDPILMVELRAHRQLQELFRKAVGDRVAILNDSDLERMAKILRKMGYFPVIEKSDETERQRQRFHW